MKQPTPPPYFNLKEPMKTITTTTQLEEIGIGSYDHWTVDQWNNLINTYIDGKDKANIRISFEKNRGYYGEIDCAFIVEEIITKSNDQYDQQVKEHKELAIKHDQAMAEYHLAMSKYLEWKAK